MELTKKTTILFSPALFDYLTTLAKQRRVSVAELVRSACEAQYGFVDPIERLEAVEQLGALGLPVASPSKLKQQSVPTAEQLLR